MNDTKEIDFRTYCNKCKYKDVEETENPCNECLAQGFNIDSRKPIRFKKEDEQNG